jgi:membrane-associated phospholipid phosphatase
MLLSWTLPIAMEPIPPSSQMLFVFLVFIVTFLLPILNLGILKTFGWIQSLEMPDRKERLIPFVLISAIYVVITYFFYWRTRIGFNDNFLKLMIIIDLLVIVATALTFFTKISVHSLTAWGVIGILIPLNKITEVPTLFYPTLVVIVLAGFIMASRLYLQVHSLKEVLWGGIVGLATSIAGMLIFFQ